MHKDLKCAYDLINSEFRLGIKVLRSTIISIPTSHFLVNCNLGFRNGQLLTPFEAGQGLNAGLYHELRLV